MRYLGSLNIIGPVLTAEHFYADIIMQNPADQSATRTAEGGPCVRKQVVLRENALDFEDELGKTVTKVGNGGMYTKEVMESQNPLVPVYDPDHPDASGNGYAMIPSIDNAEEMADLMAVTRVYETSVTALNIIKNTTLKALEIGK